MQVHAQPAAVPARACPAAQVRPVALHADQQRPLRRSKDGQTIFPIPCQRPLRAWNPHGTGISPSLGRVWTSTLICASQEVTGGSPGVRPSRRTPPTGRSTESGTQLPERGPRLRAPVRLNLPKVVRSAGRFLCAVTHIHSRIRDPFSTGLNEVRASLFVQARLLSVHGGLGSFGPHRRLADAL